MRKIVMLAIVSFVSLNFGCAQRQLLNVKIEPIEKEQAKKELLNATNDLAANNDLYKWGDALPKRIANSVGDGYFNFIGVKPILSGKAVVFWYESNNKKLNGYYVFRKGLMEKPEFYKKGDYYILVVNPTRAKAYNSINTFCAYLSDAPAEADDNGFRVYLRDTLTMGYCSGEFYSYDLEKLKDYASILYGALN